MPIYAYRCDSCGFAQDVLRKMSDPPLRDCPQCGKPTFTKQVTAAGFQLKGSGWYVTDFRDNGGKSGSGDGKSAPAVSGASASSEASSNAGASASGSSTASDAGSAAPSTSAASKPAASSGSSPAPAAASSSSSSGGTGSAGA